MKKLMNRRGFTLVEIMIVVAIIGLLAAIAIPNFVKARETAQTNACKANLKALSGAQNVWAIDTSQDSSTSVNMSDLTPTYIQKEPKCPANATASYGVTAVSADPTCGHDATNHNIS